MDHPSTLAFSQYGFQKITDLELARLYFLKEYRREFSDCSPTAVSP